MWALKHSVNTHKHPVLFTTLQAHQTPHEHLPSTTYRTVNANRGEEIVSCWGNGRKECILLPGFSMHMDILLQ